MPRTLQELNSIVTALIQQKPDGNVIGFTPPMSPFTLPSLPWTLDWESSAGTPMWPRSATCPRRSPLGRGAESRAEGGGVPTPPCPSIHQKRGASHMSDTIAAIATGTVRSAIGGPAPFRPRSLRRSERRVHPPPAGKPPLLLPGPVSGVRHARDREGRTI